MPTCRACGDRAEQFLDLGRQPLSDAFLRPEEVATEFTYDLTVTCCQGCGMVQLGSEVPRERMFHSEYPFRTASSHRMTQHFRAVADRLVAHSSTADPFVVEVGCNDGTMLRRLAETGVRHLGVDASADAVRDATAAGVQAQCAFFELETARRIAAEHGRADVVYAANTMCHIPYLDSVLAGAAALLTDDGVLVFEDPSWEDVFRLASFDQIYDEHFYLFSATSVSALALRHGFRLVDVEHLDVHGGELRYTLARSGAREPGPAPAAQVARERALGLTDPDVLAGFAERVAAKRTALLDLLRSTRAQGRSVAGYAATAKSATVLNYCGIGPDLIPCVYDTTPEKQGRLTPGTHIPVLPFPDSPDDLPDTFVLFAWNHTAEVLDKESAFRADGGRWIRYVPDVEEV
ncbi:class I SAM-dependent methyltransferase [uncultured Cellulomonas sp.]|uniref:class I SAM-dependent methyltransferase n=1 Tax=uncultured Cellulomonas sp. TaxID=189682 RepID=UPI00261717A7|nr:class I SAM-dependent methyltransferase [uncultured Cellulomonas sp.]